MGLVAVSRWRHGEETTDRSVQVWSIADQTALTQFDTIMDFGKRRLALCNSADQMVVVTGAWERHGVCR